MTGERKRLRALAESARTDVRFLNDAGWIDPRRPPRLSIQSPLTNYRAAVSPEVVLGLLDELEGR